MPVTLRPYQEDMVAKIRHAFRTYKRVLAVAPTGSGKTRTFAYITQAAADKGNRVIVMAHRQEIVTQISGALDDVGVRHGRIQTGHNLTDDPVQVAMVQTLARRIEKIPKPTLLVIDEAHHGTSGAYQKIAEAWPDIKTLGVTATPRRLDGKGLHRCFDDLVQGPEMADLIAEGFLAGYILLAPPQVADLTGISTRMGDYSTDELAEAMDKSVITGDAVNHYRTYLNGKPAIVFCVTVEHAEHVAAQFRDAGYRAASVDGKMDRAQRRSLINGIGNGELNVLTSCELISEGVDVPVVAGAILLRPTKSLGMYLQQVGRCLRPKPDGSKAIILDHVGNALQHGVPDMVRPWTLSDKKKKDAPPPVSQCEVCYKVFQTRPNWKKDAECGWSPPNPEGCVLLPEPGIGRAPPKQIEGHLVEMTDSPPWAGGIHIPSARGRDWFALLRKADSHEKLQAIARVRGYKRGWVQYILKERSSG